MNTPLKNGITHVETFNFLPFHPLKVTETAICILKWNYISLENAFIAVIRNTDFKPIPDIGYLVTVVSKNDSTRMP